MQAEKEFDGMLIEDNQEQLVNIEREVEEAKTQLDKVAGNAPHTHTHTHTHARTHDITLHARTPIRPSGGGSGAGHVQTARSAAPSRVASCPDRYCDGRWLVLS